MFEWAKSKYGGTYRTYLNGLVRGDCSCVTPGEEYTAKVGRITLTKRFPNMAEAQKALDDLVLKRAKKHIKKAEYGRE